MKCSLGISDFLEEISSLSHSIVFLYFFSLITEEGFLISPCHSWELCIQMGISFLFSFVLTSLFFFSQKKKCKKAKWLSDEALQIAKKGCTTMTQTQKYIPKISLLGIDLEYNQLLTGLLCLKTF